MDLYIYSPIRLHGVVLNKLSTGTTLTFTFTLSSRNKSFTSNRVMNTDYNIEFSSCSLDCHP
jgi:hypothetical protein